MLLGRRLNYRRDVLPMLTVETVYGNIRWTSQRGRYWHGQCPLHDDRDPKSRRFSVDTETLGYNCFSCKASGDALQWIAGGGEVTAETFREAERLVGIHRLDIPPPRLSKPPAEQRTARDLKQARTNPKATAMWTSAQPADGTPARRYLERRLVWPSLDGWPLPDSVRWIPAGTVRHILRWPKKSLPQGDWAGCMACGYSVPRSGKVQSVKLEALTVDGRHAPGTKDKRWRRNIGLLAGLRFLACDLPQGRMHLGEGEVTALALAVRCQLRGHGMAVACGGTSGMVPGVCFDPARRPILIHCDADTAGRAAAFELWRALRQSSRVCSAADLTETRTDGIDEADTLAAEVGERRAVHESGGQKPKEALREAWGDILRSQGSRGGAR